MTRAVVSVEQLEAVARLLPAEPPRPIRAGSASFDIDSWLTRYSVPVGAAAPWNGGRRWVFFVCPWNASHTDRSAYIVQFPSGAISAGCHHNGCTGNGWPELRKLYEPFPENGQIRVRESAPLNSVHSLNSLNSLNSRGEETTEEPGWPADLAPEALHGPSGEIVNELAPETEADPAALLLSLHTLFGNIIGRSAHFRVGVTPHHTNLFAVLVGYTGEARKGTSWDPIEDLFRRAFPEYAAKNIHPGGLASGEGLLSLVRDRQEKRVQIKKGGRLTMESETMVEDWGVEDKRCLVVETEMAGLLKVMSRPGNVLSQQICKAWETGNIQSISKNNPAKATGAHISILGHITPDSLKRNLTEADAASGFGNRFMWMLVKRARLLPEGGKLPLLNRHIIAIRKLVELASEGVEEIARDEAARRMWAAVYGDLVRAGVGMFGEMTARRAPIVGRLSLIYALWDGKRVIEPAHLLAALGVWERCEASLRFLYGDVTGDPTADALYDTIANRPEGAHRTDLHAALGRHRPAAELDRALTALQRDRKVVMVRQKGDGGREVEVWRPLAGTTGAAAGCGYLEKARAAMNCENSEFSENSDGEA